MSTSLQTQREIRRWLDVVVSQVNQIDERLTNGLDELTPEGQVAFLMQTKERLTQGAMVLDEEVRRALDLFMLDWGIAAFRPRADVRVPTSCYSYQEVAETDTTYSPRGQPYASAYAEGGTIGLITPV